MTGWSRRLLEVEASCVRFPGFNQVLKTQDYTVTLTTTEPVRGLVVRNAPQGTTRGHADASARPLIDDFIARVRAEGGRRRVWMLRPLRIPKQELMHHILVDSGFNRTGTGGILGWDIGNDSEARLPGTPASLKVRRVDDRVSLVEAQSIHRTGMGMAAPDNESRLLKRHSACRRTNAGKIVS